LSCLDVRPMHGVWREIWALTLKNTNMRPCGVTPAAAPLDAWARVSQLL
jgi:hypothetical protein